MKHFLVHVPDGLEYDFSKWIEDWNTSTAPDLALTFEEAIAGDEDPFDEWMAALVYVKPGQELFLNRGGYQWYANIRHEKGYVVWYMPSDSPKAALVALADALEKRGEPRHEVKGEFGRNLPEKYRELRKEFGLGEKRE